MLRCAITFLVLVGFLSSQLAVIPHAHAGFSADQQRNHDAVPHFHLGHRAGHSHAGHRHAGHRHRHAAHRHSHATPHRENAAAAGHSTSGASLGIGLPAPDHDTDAIAVVGRLSTRGSHSDPGRDVLAKALLDLAIITLLVDLPASPPGHERWRPPDKVVDASGLYLTLRNLRI